MRLRLSRRGADETTVTLVARATFPAGPLRLRYPTRTGALLRIDGVVRGAFDGKHATIDLPPVPGEHDVTLEVERRSLPIAGLPAGDGLPWRLMLARAAQKPIEHIDIDARDGAPPAGEAIGVPLVGHAHLDVAWLWTYAATHRKALRTFATALREMENDPAYVFAQSQPQLYAWVFATDRELGERIRARAGTSWDASVATMWVECDLHAPSGESVLRQFAHGIRWTRDNLGVEPTVAWLPDTFGFPATFPQLAAHAGVPYFLTTKLQWNDTTRWPHPRFRWTGDDGSSLISAVADSYDGGLTGERIKTARERDELLVVGYGDGGGGATDDDLARVGDGSRGWTRAADWFANDVAPGELPEHRGELYLETHRGTYTTHHAVKARNAELELALARAEELAAWCVAVRAPQTVRRSLADDLRSAWRIVLRAQFHDVLPGTAIGAVYTDVHAEYDRALAIAARVSEAAASV
ncbi:MAG: alpha-mannosidase, partial [Candidatus Eremiobacteraeota bacterium]|nr:alpha-mannosidase [Candidatus Eremiobacteraeota bacterium]